MRALVVALTVLMLSGCVTQEKCSKRFPCLKESDSTRIIKEYVERHDTAWRFAADSSTMQALIECEGEVPRLKQIIAYTQGKRVEIPVIKFRDKILYVECKIDSETVSKTYFERHRSEFEKIQQVKVQTEFRQRSYQAALMWLGVLALAAALVWASVKLVRGYLMR